MKRGKILHFTLMLVFLASASGCALTPLTQREGTAGIGALAGGASGAIIGSFLGSAVAGGLVGLPFGAIAGFYIGDKMSRGSAMEAKAKEPDPELARLRDENERLKQQVHASNAEAGAEKTASVTAPAKASEPKAPPQPAQRVEESSLRTLLFGADKASMTAESKQSLAPVVTALKGNPAQRVVLEGYSDSKGSDSYNQKISQKRSDAVKIFLVQSGVKPERISSRGLGEANPVATNATEDGRRRNRRVEVMIVEDQRTASGPVQ